MCSEMHLRSNNDAGKGICVAGRMNPVYSQSTTKIAACMHSSLIGAPSRLASLSGLVFLRKPITTLLGMLSAI